MSSEVKLTFSPSADAPLAAHAGPAPHGVRDVWLEKPDGLNELVIVLNVFSEGKSVMKAGTML